VILVEGPNMLTLRSMDKAGNSDTQIAEVVLDTVPPSFQIYTPTNGTWIKAHSILVKGMADQSTVWVKVNGISANIIDFQFTCEVQGLTEGYNKLTVVASDITGTLTRKDIIVFVDTIPPDFTLTDPPTITNEDVVMVQGMTDTDDAVVHVAGQVAVLDGRRFSASLHLNDGENLVDVMAQDIVGNIYVETFTIILDTVLPVIESMTPVPGSIVDMNVITMEVEVFDEYGVDTVRGRIGSEPFETLAEEGNLWKWVLTLNNGRNVLDLEVVDSAGNIAVRQVVYTRVPKTDADLVAPRVWFITPLHESTVEVGTVNVQGRAEDDVAVLKVELFIGGVQANVTGTDVWFATMEMAKGSHLLTARVYDTSGNQNVSTITLFVVQPSSGEGEKNDERSGVWTYVVVLVILLLLLGVIIFFLIKNIRMRAVLYEQANEGLQREDRSWGVGQRGPDGRTKKQSERPRGPPERTMGRNPYHEGRYRDRKMGHDGRKR